MKYAKSNIFLAFNNEEKEDAKPNTLIYENLHGFT